MGEAKKFLEQLEVKRNTEAMLNKMKKPIVAATNTGESIAIPNHSGRHDAGTTGTPVNDLDIANKKYVDDNSGGSGNVTKVGTPVNNQIGVWTGDGTIEGDSDFTWDGSTLTIAGKTAISLPDNTAEAFKVIEGAVGYLCCDTTNGSEAVKIGCGGANPIIEMTSTGLEVTGNITVSGTVDGVDVASIGSASHTQNTDTALGSGAVAADHGTAATDQIINVCYGTGSPPTANTTTEGTLFIKYTA